MNYYLGENAVSEITFSIQELLLLLFNRHDSEEDNPTWQFADTTHQLAGLIASPRVLFMSPNLTVDRLFSTGMVDEDDSCLLSDLLVDLEADDAYAVVTGMERRNKHMVMDIFRIYPDSQGAIDSLIRKHIIDNFLIENA